MVARIFDLYVHRGLGSAAISNLLNDEGQTTGRRCRWTPHGVLNILRNPTYIGRLPFHGETYRLAHTALVGLATFQRAQAVMAVRGESWARPCRQRR